MVKTVYADNAATTALSQSAFEAMLPYLKNEYGNPSSIYAFGRNAKRAVENAREKVASVIGALPEEIYFTSGGTEADNWAIKSAAKLSQTKGKHIISTEIEHHAVLHTLEALKEQGYDSTFLKVNEFGQISTQQLCLTARNDTVLISIMAANNEIGTILPTKEIGAIARERGVIFHTDAVQAVGHIPINVREMNIDMLSLAGHKFRGPKGVGALYVKKGLSLPPLIHGGGQERNLRCGTENVAGIVGLGAALEEASVNMKENMKKVSALRDKLIDGVLRIQRVRLTGDPTNRLPGIASFAIEGIEGESMVMMLDQNGIRASSGSACSSGSQKASHVLLATGLPDQLAHSSLRFSLNEDNSEDDVDYILGKLSVIITHLRGMSPVWK
jgi:cysteine desulfurase